MLAVLTSPAHKPVAAMSIYTVIKLCSLLALFAVSRATEYFVSLDGSDANPGDSIDKPFRHVTKAVEFLKPGDLCSIRGGIYDEYVPIVALEGTFEQPITFRAYPGEDVLFDGTMNIQGTWSVYKGLIYTTTLEQPIWQLFVDDKMQVNARWPNAFWQNFTVFNESFWASSASNSTYDHSSATGVMVDDGDKNLAGTGFDCTGAMALLNIGSWLTFAGKVVKHSPGENSFAFDLQNNPGGISFKPSRNRYILEDKLELLDAPTEWFFDKNTNKLYLWADDGENPAGRKIRGKVTSYSLNITSGSSYLVFSGIRFFATTLAASAASTHDKNVHNILFDSLYFSYPTYSQRMLGLVDIPNSTYVYAHGNLDIMPPTNFTFFNCTFEYGDGMALVYRGSNGMFVNNLWHHNDYSCVGLHSSCGSICSLGMRDSFIRNTVHSNGPSVGYTPGQGDAESGSYAGSLVQLNHFYDLKSLQHDGSHVQLTTNVQNGTIVSHNWAHDTKKNAFRFDREIQEGAKWGYNATVIANVAWNTNGIMVKGDYHKVEDNLSFNNQNGESNTTVDLVVLGLPGQGAPGENKHTVVSDNLLQKGSSASRRGGDPITAIARGNLQGDVRKLLRDPDNLDFRPVGDSVLDAGPYGKESQENGGVYWIPGRQRLVPSTPIPPNNATTAKCNAHLMWLSGYDATSHHVYFGSDVDSVTRANTSSPEFRVDMTMPANIFDPGPLKPLVKYAWRIDTVYILPTPREHDIIKSFKGDVWQFQCQ